MLRLTLSRIGLLAVTPVCWAIVWLGVSEILIRGFLHRW